jgi:hypothetical protein
VPSVSPPARRPARVTPTDGDPLSQALNQRNAVQRVAQQGRSLQAGPRSTGLRAIATALQRRATPHPATRGGTVQRLVASASEAPTDDRVFQNTTLVAHTMVGGKIKRLSTIDFTKDFAGPGEGLAVTAHGNINSVGDYSGEGVATRLTHPVTGLPDGSHDVHFQSCYAAVEGTPPQATTTASPTGSGGQGGPVVTPTSVIGTAKAALVKRANDAKWTRVPEVSGSAGPQIFVRTAKANAPGFDFDKVVVDPAQLSIAGPIQNVLIKVMEPVKDKVSVNFGGEGADFIRQAEPDDAKVTPLKQVFISLVRGKPGNIDRNLLASLKAEWLAQGGSASLARSIFDTGLDLRAKQETVKL